MANVSTLLDDHVTLGRLCLGLARAEHDEIIGVADHRAQGCRLRFPQRIERMQVDVGEQG